MQYKKSFYKTSTSLFCVSERKSWFLFYKWEWLKDFSTGEKYEVYGYTYCIIAQCDNRAVNVEKDTCENLIKQCQEQFGSEYAFIQSEGGILLWNGVIDSAGALCPHAYLSDYSLSG